MRTDEYNEVINHADTFKAIAKELKKSKAVLIDQDRSLNLCRDALGQQVQQRGRDVRLVPGALVRPRALEHLRGSACASK